MFALLILASIGAAPPTTAPVIIERTSGPLQVRVVANLPTDVAKKTPTGALKQEEGETILTFALIDPETGKVGDSMFGRYEHAEGKLIFTPRHNLLGGERYRATMTLGTKILTAEYAAPLKKIDGVPTVEKLYPTADVLPANLLKFYIYFSRPMRESATVFDHMRILDEKGHAIDDPWRRTELWSEDGKRLTLWIHPGRIKRGVNLREQVGPVLEPDREYTLEIGGKLQDVDGVAMGKAFVKKFKTTKAVRSFVLVEDWELTAPKTTTRDALSLRFPRSLDHALLRRMVRVLDKDGKRVAGKIEVGKLERSLTFTPEVAWRDESYQVVVDPELEDLAGNTPEQLFDVDNAGPETPLKAQKMTFRPKK